MPDFGHVRDLSAFELHDVDVVGFGGLAGRLARATCQVGAGENAIGADIVALGIGGEGPNLVAAVSQHCHQALHPVGVLLECVYLR